jgi:hypothetical protein
MYDNLFIPVDGSDPSMAGLGEVIRLANGQARTIRLVHIVDGLRWNAA